MPDDDTARRRASGIAGSARICPETSTTIALFIMIIMVTAAMESRPTAIRCHAQRSIARGFSAGSEGVKLASAQGLPFPDAGQISSVTCANLRE